MKEQHDIEIAADLHAEYQAIQEAERQEAMEGMPAGWSEHPEPSFEDLLAPIGWDLIEEK